MNIAHAATEGGISIHLAPSVIGHFLGLPITNTLITVWLSMIVISILSYIVYKNRTMIPGKLQLTMELLIGGAYDYIEETLGNKRLAERYFPVIMTIFLFLLSMNWLGLLPGVTSIGFWEGHGAETHLVPLLYPPATDLNNAIGFAFVAMLVIEFAGIAALGAFRYGSKFINFSSPMNFFVGILELISELGRVISFSFRLFGNIFAGKTLLVVGMFFVPYFLPVPILAYEVFVGFIQAGVFAFLTLIFIKLAVTDPHPH